MRKKKVILITGASSGIGHATAKSLLEEGNIVYCTARRVEKMDDLKALGGEIVYVDVTDEKTIKNAMELVIKNEKRIDAVFANAGYGCAGALETVSIEDAKKEFDVNLFGVARTINAVMPYMRKQRYGYIIVTSSIAAVVSIPCMPYYPASKSALEGLIDGFRMESKKFGVKVVKIQPYFANTPFIYPVKKTLHKAMQSENAEYYKNELISFGENFEKLILKGYSPEKVAGVVSRVLKKKHPKTTYEVGWQCKLIKIAKCIFGDRLADFLIRIIILGES